LHEFAQLLAQVWKGKCQILNVKMRMRSLSLVNVKIFEQKLGKLGNPGKFVNPVKFVNPSKFGSPG
jgi:hypothetical protein